MKKVKYLGSYKIQELTQKAQLSMYQSLFTATFTLALDQDQKDKLCEPDFFYLVFDGLR